MKKVLVLLFIFSISVRAQIDVVAGMGISFVAAPSLNDYLNFNFPVEEEISTFSSTGEFYGEVDYTLAPTFQLGIEYVFSLYGFTSAISGLNYELNYVHHKPSLLAYYVISGNGYKFKFGGGVGMRFVDLSEKKIITEDFSTNGFGVLARIQGHTKLGGSFYANIGGTARYDLPGEPKDGDKELFNVVTNETVNLNSFSVSVDIGVSYFF
jgi:hypothetical protein